MSSATSVNGALGDYAAGRITAEELVSVVTAAYWSQESGARSREALRPIIDVIEKAHPGIVELGGTSEKPGFAVRVAERPFPKRHEEELRQAVQNIVGAQHAAPLHDPSISVPPASGFLSRIVAAIRKIFTA
jgi:hypothetical protein